MKTSTSASLSLLTRRAPGRPKGGALIKPFEVHVRRASVEYTSNARRMEAA